MSSRASWGYANPVRLRQVAEKSQDSNPSSSVVILQRCSEQYRLLLDLVASNEKTCAAQIG